MALIGKYFRKDQAAPPPSVGGVGRGAALGAGGGVRPPHTSQVAEPSSRAPAPAAPYEPPTRQQQRPVVHPSVEPTKTIVGDPTKDRVRPTMPVAKSTAELPAYFAVFSAIESMVEAPEQFRRFAAALQVDNQAAVVVWTNTQEGMAARRALNERLHFNAIAVREEIEASSDLILSLNTRGGGSQKSTLAGMPIEADKVDDVLNHIVGNALAAKASDIHIEVSAQRAIIRFRVHGELFQFGQMTFEEADAFSRGLYLRSETDTKGTQFDPKQCQDSSIKRDIVLAGQADSVPVKLRFASRPAYPEGWDITLRVLSTKTGDRVESFADLGYDAEQINAFEVAARQPRGVILMVGETGSGKSTTLRTITYWLHEQNGGRKKLISVEDPPEYLLPGRQTPVLRTKQEEERGVDAFARFLRSAMRGDPDELLVGEVRDPETAKALTTASLSGHKVLATLHAGSPFAAFGRLEEMGIKRSLLASPKFISAIAFQKLVPIVCPCCALSFEEMGDALPPKLRSRLTRLVPAENMENIRFRGPGCKECRKENRASAAMGVSGPAGIIGRTVIAEILLPDPTLLDLIGKGDELGAYRYWRAAAHPKADIDHRGVAMGRSVLDQGIQKMLSGILDPRDLESAAGPMDDQESAKDAHSWWNHYAKHVAGKSTMRVTSSTGGNE